MSTNDHPAPSGFSSAFPPVEEEFCHHYFHDFVRSPHAPSVSLSDIKVAVAQNVMISVHDYLREAARLHFNGNNNIDYVLVPVLRTKDDVKQTAPFGLYYPSACVINPTDFRSINETVLHKLSNGASLTADDYNAFTNQYETVFPVVKQLADTTHTLLSKVTALADHSKQALIPIAQTQASCCDAINYLANNNFAFMNDTSIRLASIESQVAEFCKNMTSNLRPIAFSDHPSVQYDIVQDSFSTPSITNPDSLIHFTDSKEQLSVTESNKQITMTKQSTFVHHPDGTVVLPKPIVRAPLLPTPTAPPRKVAIPPNASFSDVVKKNVKLSDIRTRKGRVDIKANVDDVTPNKRIELFDLACVSPKEVQKYCDCSNDGVSTDLHVSCFPFDSTSLSAHDGVLCYTYYLLGCSDPLPLYLIAKDDSNTPKHQNSNGIACDLIFSRKLALHFGFINVNTECVAVPFLRRDAGPNFLPGLYSGRFGSIQRRWHNRTLKFFDQVSTSAYKVVSAGGSILTVIELVHSSLIKFLCSHDFSQMPDVDPIPPLNTFHGVEPANQSLRTIDSKFDHLIRALPLGNLKLIPKCLEGCLNLKDSRHGLMYGSHVIFNNVESKFETPCGTLLADISEYWRHPCTVRARTIAIQPVHPVDHIPGVRSTNLKSGIPCPYCGRLYVHDLDATNCAIFCGLIPNGVDKSVLRRGVIRTRPNPEPVTSFGVSIFSSLGISTAFQED